MSFIYIDRVISLARARRIVATRQLTIAEDVFQQHFPGNPMLPASLQIEAFAQAATILLETSMEFRNKAFVGYVENAKFRKPIRPGREMTVDLKIEQAGDDGALVRGSVSQDHGRCATIVLGMATAPMAQFITPPNLPYYLAMYRPWLAETRFEDFDHDPLERVSDAAP